MEEIRTILYPLLGILVNICYGARFIIQWLQSEIKGQSIVPRSFWQFSLAGNIFLALHSFVQIQFHVCLIQCCNAVISTRNLSLMVPNKPQPPLSRVFLTLFMIGIGVIIAFFLQDFYLYGGQWNWFQAPAHKWQSQNATQLPFIWHVFGFASYALFSSRFWVQWLESEKHQRSELNLSFWWLSVIGAVCSVIYFISLRDLVNAIGPGIGLIPYTRNLMLIYKNKKSVTAT